MNKIKVKKYVLSAVYIAAALAICFVIFQMKREMTKTTPGGTDAGSDPDVSDSYSTEYITEVSPGYVDYIPSDKDTAVRLLSEKLNTLSVENRTKASVDTSVEFIDVNVDLQQKEDKLKTISDAINKYKTTAEYNYGDITDDALPFANKLPEPQEYTVIMGEDAVLTMTFTYNKTNAQTFCEQSKQFFTQDVKNDLQDFLTVNGESVQAKDAQVIARINEHSGLLYSLEVIVRYNCAAEATFPDIGVHTVSFDITERTMYAFEREGIYFTDKKVTLSAGDVFVFRVDIHLPAGYENEPYDLVFRSSAPDILNIDPVTGEATALAASEEGIDVVAVLSFKNRLKVYQDICDVVVRNDAEP